MIYPWQKSQWQQLQQQRAQARLPHALLLFGDAGTGKADFAHTLAASILCRAVDDATGVACGQCSACHLRAAKTHPDLVLIKPEPPKVSTSKKPMLLIRIEPVRDLCTRMAMTAQFENGYRVVIIEDADRMNVEAANALLKTLEEPGRNSLLILTSSHPSRLPATVVSRCQGLRFSRPERDIALAWLNSQKLPQAELKLELAHGAPLLALQQDTEMGEARQQFSAALLAGIKQNGLAHASMLAALPKHQCLSWMLDWVGDLVRLRQAEQGIRLVNEDHRAVLQTYAQHVDARRLFELYDQVGTYIRAESIALNAELLWENLLLSWQGLKQ